MNTKKQSGAENRAVRILLVDDHPIVLQGLTQLLNHEAGLTVGGVARDAEGALKAIEEVKPDLAIIDISLPGSNGLELIKTIKNRYPQLPVLVLSMHDESVYAERAIRAGARGYIMKEEATKSLLNSIRRVLNGQIYLSEKMSSKLLSQIVSGRPDTSGAPIEHLSDRELEVFQLIGQGRATRQIAIKLRVSLKTVETYRERIKNKLKLKHAAELTWHAINWTRSAGRL